MLTRYSLLPPCLYVTGTQHQFFFQNYLESAKFVLTIETMDIVRCRNLLMEALNPVFRLFREMRLFCLRAIFCCLLDTKNKRTRPNQEGFLFNFTFRSSSSVISSTSHPPMPSSLVSLSWSFSPSALQMSFSSVLQIFFDVSMIFQLAGCSPSVP